MVVVVVGGGGVVEQIKSTHVVRNIYYASSPYGVITDPNNCCKTCCQETGFVT